MNKQIIKLNEAQLEELVQECVKSFLNEQQNEGALWNMLKGTHKAIKDYKAAQEPDKEATKKAKIASREANQLARKYGRYIDKDIEAIKGILERYKKYPSIERSSRFITGALANLKSKMSTEAENAKDNYITAMKKQEKNKEQLDTNMIQGVRDTFSGNTTQPLAQAV